MPFVYSWGYNCLIMITWDSGMGQRKIQKDHIVLRFYVGGHFIENYTSIWKYQPKYTTFHKFLSLNFVVVLCLPGLSLVLLFTFLK